MSDTPDPKSPTPVTEERVTEIVTNVVKEAFGSLKLPEAPQIDMAALAAEVAKIVKPEPGEKGENVETKGENEQVLAMRRKLEEMERKNAESERKARMQARDAAIRDALVAHGADAGRIDVARNHLVASGAVIERDDGSWVMSGTDRFDQPTEVTVADGVKDFLGSDTGKMFLPPKPVDGTGSRVPSPGNVHGSGDLTPKQVAGIAVDRLLGGDFTGQ